MRALASSDRRAPSGPRATTAHHTPDGSVILDFTDITGALEARGSDHPIGFELCGAAPGRSEEHTSELQSLMRISYAVFCLKKKTKSELPPELSQKHILGNLNSF